MRLHQGGSAANTARWLARLGVGTTLVCAVGRDGPGRALVAALEEDGVVVRARRSAGHRTARIGMLVDAAGERSFVADRGAADRLEPGDLRPAWFRGAGVLHLPAYSLLGEPLAQAGLRAAAMARQAGAFVSIDLASAGPLLEHGRLAARESIETAAPDILFTNAAEAMAFLGDAAIERLLDVAPIAAVKRGPGGATLLARSAAGPAIRLEVPTRPVAAADTTGAGDAFDAGFLAEWLAHDRAVTRAALRRAVVAGHRTAARQVTVPRAELQLGRA